MSRIAIIDPVALFHQRRDDAERMNFLQRLDNADIEVTDWEASFIESFLGSPRAFTPAQRSAVDGMRETYEGRL